MRKVMANKPFLISLSKLFWKCVIVAFGGYCTIFMVSLPTAYYEARGSATFSAVLSLRSELQKYQRLGNRDFFKLDAGTAGEWQPVDREKLRSWLAVEQRPLDGKVVDGLLVDTWGQEIVVRVRTGGADELEFEVRSPGYDGKLNTDDDVVRGPESL